MLFYLARKYAQLYIFALTKFNINIRGFGFILRQLKGKRLLHVKHLDILFDSRASLSYGRLLAGQWNEPEAHMLAQKLATIYKKITFIDVGANIGEIVSDLARMPEVQDILAFEPDPVCSNIIEVNCALNQLSQVTVIQAALSSTEGHAFLTNAGTPQASLSEKCQSPEDKDVPITTLDIYLKNHPITKITQTGDDLVLLLIDVEGHEVEVMQGAKRTIHSQKPLIVFEFNTVSRKHFSLADVEKCLGKDYVIFRLNQQGLLDKNLDHTWNCAAIHTSQIKKISSLIQG